MVGPKSFSFLDNFRLSLVQIFCKIYVKPQNLKNRIFWKTIFLTWNNFFEKLFKEVTTFCKIKESKRNVQVSTFPPIFQLFHFSFYFFHPHFWWHWRPNAIRLVAAPSISLFITSSFFLFSWSLECLIGIELESIVFLFFWKGKIRK